MFSRADRGQRRLPAAQSLDEPLVFRILSRHVAYDRLPDLEILGHIAEPAHMIRVCVGGKNVIDAGPAERPDESRHDCIADREGASCRNGLALLLLSPRESKLAAAIYQQRLPVREHYQRRIALTDVEKV